MGAWIETRTFAKLFLYALSHPTWVRGLKLVIDCLYSFQNGRTLHGCVD